MADGAAARLRRHREHRRNAGAGAAPARRAGGPRHGRQQHPRRRRTDLRRSTTGSSPHCSGRTTRSCGVAARALARVVAGAATPRRHRPGARPRGGGRARPRWPRWAPTRRRCCTPCTGTWPSTRRSTAASTAATGSASTVSPPRSWPAPRRRCASTRSGTCTWPPRWPSTPTGGRPRTRASTWSCSAGSTRARGRTSAPGWHTGSGSRWCWPGRSGPYHRPAATWPRRATRPGRTRTCGTWRDEVAPHVDGDRVRWVGTVAGQERDDLLATAPRGAVSAALGGAGRHRGGRVAGPGHAGGRPPPGAACRSWSSTAAPGC